MFLWAFLEFCPLVVWERRLGAVPIYAVTTARLPLLQGVASTPWKAGSVPRTERKGLLAAGRRDISPLLQLPLRPRNFPYLVFFQSDSGASPRPPVRMPAPASSRRPAMLSGDSSKASLILRQPPRSHTAAARGRALLPFPRPPCQTPPKGRKSQREQPTSCWWDEVEPTNDLGECDQSHSILIYHSKRPGTSPKPSSAPHPSLRPYGTESHVFT